MPIVDVPQALRDKLGPEATKEFIELLNTVREEDYQRMKEAVRDIVRAEIAIWSEKINKRISGLEISFSERINSVETSLNERINSVETSLNERINSVETSLNERINSVETSLNERIDDKHSSLLRWVIGLIVPLYIVIILGFISLVVTLAP